MTDTEQWRQYPYQTGDLTFPDDEGIHQDNPYGWWYVSMHLRDAEDNKVIMFTSFVSVVNEQLGSVADLSRGKHLGQYIVGETTAASDHLDVQFTAGDSQPNYLRQVENEPFKYEFFYQLSGYEFTLSLDSVKPPYALAETGLVRQLPSTYSYYYVQPRLNVTGTMQRDDGSITEVTGIAWLDRQWYPSSNPGTDMYMGHFWAALHLSDGTDISAYRALGEGGSSPYPLFEVMGPDNSYAHYAENTIIPLELFKTPPTGEGFIKEFQFPLSAKIVHATTETDLTLTIEAPDPMDNVLKLGTKGCFFEGGFSIKGTHRGKPVTGDAFVEVSLFGAHEQPDQLGARQITQVLSAEQLMLQESATKFFAKETPFEWIVSQIKSNQCFDPALWAKLAEQGYLGLIVPERSGGLGLGPVELVLISEVMGKSCTPGPWLSTLWASTLLASLPISEDTSRLLGEIVSGRKRISVVFPRCENILDCVKFPIESEQTSDGLRLNCTNFRAMEALDSEYLLIHSANAAGDPIIVVCVKNAKGISIREIPGLDNLQPVFEISMDNVTVPGDSIAVSPEEAGFALNHALWITSLAATADRIGSAGWMLQTTTGYLDEYEKSGNSIPAFKDIKPRAENLLQRLSNARSATLWAAAALETGASESQNAVALARMATLRTVMAVGDLINQCQEGMGMSWEADLFRFRELPPFFGSIAIPLISQKGI